MKKVVIATAFFIALLATFFYFVPAFRGEISVQPTIDFGLVSIRWYGLTLAAAILIGYSVARKNSWRFGIDKNEIDNLAFWLVLVGLVGARIYYVLFDYRFFLQHPSEIYKIWHGGISIYGALLAGAVFLWFYARKKAYSTFQLFDLVALGTPLAQAIGRLGNFFNQEAYGYPTNLPWKMYVRSTDGYHHQTFLYEALASVAIFLILSQFSGKIKSGSLAVCYLGLYSLARFFIEPLRVDSVFVYGFRADQVIAFFIILICISILIYKPLTGKIK